MVGKRIRDDEAYALIRRNHREMKFDEPEGQNKKSFYSLKNRPSSSIHKA